ncbi:aryl hydrocarbon receptor [Anaeramoeba flamelloides]|uniref:Aryl hydrocarbon receptor n=1 Tax=Anaeramoeba flamelloides TaxID=1746091 RepID=A0AAV7Y683_9EUKA|nr:aryl hydrocarbon receptor [Anaeramoeba flamelloides]
MNIVSQQNQNSFHVSSFNQNHKISHDDLGNFLILNNKEMILKFLVNNKGVEMILNLILNTIKTRDTNKIFQILNTLMKLSQNKTILSKGLFLFPVLATKIEKIILKNGSYLFSNHEQKIKTSINGLVQQLKINSQEFSRKRSYQENFTIEREILPLKRKKTLLKKFLVSKRSSPNKANLAVKPTQFYIKNKIITDLEIKKSLELADYNKFINKNITNGKNKEIKKPQKKIKTKKSVTYKSVEKLTTIETFEKSVTNKKIVNRTNNNKRYNNKRNAWKVPMLIIKSDQQKKIKEHSKEKSQQEYRQNGELREIYIFGNKPPFSPDEPKEEEKKEEKEEKEEEEKKGIAIISWNKMIIQNTENQNVNFQNNYNNSINSNNFHGNQNQNQNLNSLPYQSQINDQQQPQQSYQYQQQFVPNNPNQNYQPQFGQNNQQFVSTNNQQFEQRNDNYLYQNNAYEQIPMNSNFNSHQQPMQSNFIPQDNYYPNQQNNYQQWQPMNQPTYNQPQNSDYPTHPDSYNSFHINNNIRPPNHHQNHHHHPSQNINHHQYYLEQQY